MLILRLEGKMLAVLVSVGFSLQFQNVLGVPLREIYPIGDERHDAISNIELLLPIMMKGHGSEDKRDIHYPNDVRDFDLNLHPDKPSDYINNNVDFIPDSSENKPIFVRKINKKLNSVKKQLKNNLDDNIVMSLLKDTKSDEPKPVPLELIKVCDRLLQHKGHEINNIKIEIAMHFCKELFDTIINNKDISEEDERDDSEEQQIPVNKSKYGSDEENFNSDECPCCPQYVISDPKHFDDDDHLHDLVKIRSPMHFKLLDAPVGWFGPYNGRRDWMVVNEQYPGKLKNYVNKYKKPRFSKRIHFFQRRLVCDMKKEFAQ